MQRAAADVGTPPGCARRLSGRAAASGACCRGCRALAALHEIQHDPESAAALRFLIQAAALRALAGQTGDQRYQQLLSLQGEADEGTHALAARLQPLLQRATGACGRRARLVHQQGSNGSSACPRRTCCPHLMQPCSGVNAWRGGGGGMPGERGQPPIRRRGARTHAHAGDATLSQADVATLLKKEQLNSFGIMARPGGGMQAVACLVCGGGGGACRRARFGGRHVSRPGAARSAGPPAQRPGLRTSG